MITFLPLMLVLVVSAAARKFAKDPDVKVGALAFAAIALLGLGLTSLVRVPDGHVSAVSTFGVFSDETKKPGIGLIAPWQGTSKIDARLQCRSFGATTSGDQLQFSSAVSAQADGGGNLTIDMNVCTQANPEKGVELLRQIGPNFADVLLSTTPRSCLRNSAQQFTVEQNFGEKRVQLGNDTRECINEFTSPRGLDVIEVQISDVDPGERVRQAIDDKEQAKNELQLAATELEKARIEAEKQAAEALGIAQAEQIVACGGEEVTARDDQGNRVTTVKPNETCEDQFSTEYLQWLYINQLSEIDGVVVLPPQLDENLFLTLPAPDAAGQ